jgi:FlaA1/EpsC-like NDP-sugar epimerase
VYTGLRPGEKLTEDLLSAGEPDVRPCHPLIRQVPVSPLAPHQVTSLDPAGCPAEVRVALAERAQSAAVDSDTDTIRPTSVSQSTVPIVLVT